MRSAMFVHVAIQANAWPSTAQGNTGGLRWRGASNEGQERPVIGGVSAGRGLIAFAL